MSVEDETWDRPICNHCSKRILYGENAEHRDGICLAVEATPLYAIIITKTRQVVDAATFKEYWKNYGGNSLYGWRKPKKIYTKLHLAKTGFSHIPDDLKPHLSIAEFSFKEILMDGADLQADQESRKRAKEENNRLKSAKRQLELKEREYERLKQELGK